MNRPLPHPCHRLTNYLVLLLAVATTATPAVLAQRPPCLPCAGVRVTDSTAMNAVPSLLDGARLSSVTATPAPVSDAADTASAAPAAGEAAPTVYVAWTVPLTETATADPAVAVHAAGGTPWISLPFTTPTPLTANLDALQRELEQAARVAAAIPAGTHVQIRWEPIAARPDGDHEPAPGATAFSEVAAAQEAETGVPPSWATDYAFLLKRAAVAVGGAQPDARIVSAPLPADETVLRDLYAGDVAAYVDVLAFAPTEPEALLALQPVLVELDPGRPLVVDAIDLPAEPSAALLAAARYAGAGASLTLFATPSLDAAGLAPLATMAKEHAGDLSADPYSPPTGAGDAYAFVRGKDLGLRVIVAVPEGAREEARLVFADPQLRRPARVDLVTGERTVIGSARATAEGLVVRVADPGPVALLELERATAAELEGIEEKVTIADERQMPVEEILRRLQAFEDAQQRKLTSYRGERANSLRFVSGGQSIDVTFAGPVFFERDKGFDWAWRDLFFGGVKWRGKEIPEIPLIQPEKAAVMPTEITFGKTYRYRLRGTDTVDGRDCWVIDFEPTDTAAAAAQNLYQGTVWVDRAVYARVRTRALQLGLEGDVLSNEEILEYRPVDANGAAAAWGPEAYVLPLRTTGQQILSILNTATVVEREVRIEGLHINDPEFAAERAKVASSDVTMVRDTEAGLRYLVKDDSGTRVVKEGWDTSKVFAIAGTFYDDGDDMPLPLLGINYLDLDFRKSGAQANLFFAGAIAIGNLATPSLFGSRFDAGIDLFALAIKSSDKQYRDGEENEDEEIQSRPARVTFNLGHPLGKFAKLDLDFGLEHRTYHRADDTDPAFVLPEDTLTQYARLGLGFARQGYVFSLNGEWAKRSDWGFWGLPGNPEFDPEQEDYLRWEISAAKNWYLPKFQQVGLEIDYLGGEDLDRFSKYEFGYFGSTRIKGVSGSSVRAEEAWLAHLDYGFEVGSALRVGATLDGALVTDEASGFDQETVAGIGIGGTVMGPWSTIVNFDIGTPLAGPDDGVVLYLVFLKLFNW